MCVTRAHIYMYVCFATNLTAKFRTEASTNGEENQLQQPKIADQQPPGHKEQVQLFKSFTILLQHGLLSATYIDFLKKIRPAPNLSPSLLTISLRNLNLHQIYHHHC